MQCRNPWGKGEWTGAWSDNSEEWERNPAVMSAMKADPEIDFTLEEDGTFWIEWKDFVKQYNKIYICRTFGKKYKQYVVNGKWKDKSAAGKHREMMDRDENEAKDEEPRAEDHVGNFSRQNGDMAWFNNPQYKLTVKKKCELLVDLMQDDKRMTMGKDAENFAIDFVVIKKPLNFSTRVWEEDPSEIVGSASGSNFANRFPQREVSKGSIKLSPKHIYFVVPYTAVRNVQAPFYLRLFCDEVHAHKC